MTTTKHGDRVNPHSNLCDACSSFAAQTAVFWADDAKFKAPSKVTRAQRFRQLQESLARDVAECVERCGRRDTPEPPGR